MNELIMAAKALIERWDTFGGITTKQSQQLRVAVANAENTIKETECYEHGYIAGQKAMKAHERERIKQIITYQFGDLVSDLSDVMKMIDDH